MPPLFGSTAKFADVVAGLVEPRAGTNGHNKALTDLVMRNGLGKHLNEVLCHRCWADEAMIWPRLLKFASYTSWQLTSGPAYAITADLPVAARNMTGGLRCGLQIRR